MRQRSQPNKSKKNLTGISVNNNISIIAKLRHLTRELSSLDQRGFSHQNVLLNYLGCAISPTKETDTERKIN